MIVLLAGCTRQELPPAAPHRVVVRISVSTQSQDLSAQREYTSPEKMGAVLGYLRLLRPSSKASVNPQHVKGEMYYITLTNSDGSQITYQQKADRYFLNRDGDWVVIDPGFGARLPELLENLTSD